MANFLEDFLRDAGLSIQTPDPSSHWSTDIPLKIDGQESCEDENLNGYKGAYRVLVDNYDNALHLYPFDKVPKTGDLKKPTDAQWRDILYTTDGFTYENPDRNNSMDPSTLNLGICRGKDGSVSVYKSHPVLTNYCPENPGGRTAIPALSALSTAETVELVNGLTGGNPTAQSSLFCVSEPNRDKGNVRALSIQSPQANPGVLPTLESWIKGLPEGSIKKGLQEFIQPAIDQRAALDEGVGWLKPTLKQLPSIVLSTILFLAGMHVLNKKIMGQKIDPKEFLLDKSKDAKRSDFTKLIPSDRTERAKAEMTRSTQPDNDTRHIFMRAPGGLDLSESGGIGKSEMAMAWMHDVAAGKVEHLRGYGVIVFESGKFAAKGGIVGATDRATDAMDEAVKKNPKVIIYIKEAHLLKGLGSASIGDGKVSSDFVERLLTRMKGEIGYEFYGEVIFLFDTNKSDVLLEDGAFERRVNQVEIPPPDNKEAEEIIRQREIPKLPSALKIKGNVLGRLVELSPVLRGGGMPARAIDTFQDFRNWLQQNDVSGDISNDHLVTFAAEKMRVTPGEVRKLMHDISLLRGKGVGEMAINNFLKTLRKEGKVNENEVLSPQAIHKLLQQVEAGKQAGLSEEDILNKLNPDVATDSTPPSSGERGKATEVDTTEEARKAMLDIYRANESLLGQESTVMELVEQARMSYDPASGKPFAEWAVRYVDMRFIAEEKAGRAVDARIREERERRGVSEEDFDLKEWEKVIRFVEHSAKHGVVK